MYLKCRARKKDGKEHRYWSVVESVRTRVGTGKRQLLYLGEINDAQHAAWCKAISVFDEEAHDTRQMTLLPSDRPAPAGIAEPVHICLDGLMLKRPRQWGACWLVLELWDQLELDAFWRARLMPSRKGTDWLNVLKTLVCYRLIDPGSEWKLHRLWFVKSAMADLLGEDYAVAMSETLYRCLDKLGRHKNALFVYLKERWMGLFQAEYDILLYDLTSTYFECDVPVEGKRRFGHSRDRRSDCVQVVIALIVTTDGLPVAYEVMQGNTSDKTTLLSFLEKIEKQYGQAQRLWLMDRGIPTEESLEQMRKQGGLYLVGTPRGRLKKLERSFLSQSWDSVRDEVAVKLVRDKEELYVLTRSLGRRQKERGIRKRKLKKLWARLKELRAMKKLSRDELLMKLGAAKKEAGRAWNLVEVTTPGKDQTVTPKTFRFSLNKSKLRQTRKDEGCYLLRTNYTDQAPAELWRTYILLTEVEQAFKELKNDLHLRPIHHQLDTRIEAHIFVCFLAYCLNVTLKQIAKHKAPGLTPRSILEQFKEIRMIDVHLPTNDGRMIIMPRYTEPDEVVRLLLNQLNLKLPSQPPPKIQAAGKDFVGPTF